MYNNIIYTITIIGRTRYSKRIIVFLNICLRVLSRYYKKFLLKIIFLNICFSFNFFELEHTVLILSSKAKYLYIMPDISMHCYFMILFEN